MKTSLRICEGSDCRKHKKSNKAIAKLLESHCKVSTMKCQDYCKGPVIRVRRDGERRWFKKVRGKKLRGDLLTYVREGTLSKRLKKRQVARTLDL